MFGLTLYFLGFSVYVEENRLMQERIYSMLESPNGLICSSCGYYFGVLRLVGKWMPEHHAVAYLCLMVPVAMYVRLFSNLILDLGTRFMKKKPRRK